jgi:hypothetical protein
VEKPSEIKPPLLISSQLTVMSRMDVKVKDGELKSMFLKS